jgi:acyl-CoA thioester hydrolase
MAKPPAVALAKITALKHVYTLTIPPDYQDYNGHMNIRWYMVIFDDAGYPLYDELGLTPDYLKANGVGGFDLEHHLHYLNEVHVGDTIAVYVRLLARTVKRMHYLMFMVNQTRGSLASIFECVNSFADLNVRRTAPYPPEIAAKIDTLVAADSALDWPAPVSGVMQA